MPTDNSSTPVRSLICGMVVFGLLSMSLVIYSQWLQSRGFEQNTSLIRMTQVIQQEIATAHLWFEEALGGDRSINLDEDVHQRIRKVVALVNQALDGEQSLVGYIDPPPKVRHKLQQLRDEILLFDTLVDSRWAGRASTGIIGGAEDQAFDTVFHEILALSQSIAEQIEVVIAANKAQIFVINSVLLLVLAVLFTTTAVLIARNQRVLDSIARITGSDS